MFVLESIKQYAKTDRIALINRDESLSFTDLDAQSDAFAAYLLERFGNDRTPIVIYGHKQTDFLPCIYGALKSGRAYVPVDTVVPPERLSEIVADVNPKVVVDFSKEEIKTEASVLNAEALKEVFQRETKIGISKDIWVSGEEMAYILFTSGSTGRPKGVAITANNLANFYRGLLPFLEEVDGGVVLNQISYSFDVSCCSIYVGISKGMTLFTVDKDMTENIGSMFTYLQSSQLAMWVSTPSFAELCMGSKLFEEALIPQVQCFLFCGEILTHKLCDGLAERFPKARVLNTYGPTEATVLVTAIQITESIRRNEQSIPIGYPLNEVVLRLVDEKETIVERDEVCGELLILSDSVGPGYYRRPDLTEKCFFLDEATGKRGYRTGDICYRKEGCYYYTGRVDNQLKLNGYRVELEDIETNLSGIENIARAAVVPVWADAERSRVQYLVAFLLLEQDDGLTALKRSIQIKKKAALTLPAYMIPRKLIVVDVFPLNTNGKIDKKELVKRLEEAERL